MSCPGSEAGIFGTPFFFGSLGVVDGPKWFDIARDEIGGIGIGI
jgi:hypothetical protein